MKSDFHRSIKEATALVHSQLESSSIFADYLRDDLDPIHYRKIITQSYVGYSYWQSELDAAFSKFNLSQQWQTDLKPCLLEKESSITCKQLEHFGTPRQLPVSNIEHYLGCAYVFEGSKMGASVILKSLRNNPQLKGEHFYYFDSVTQNESLHQSWVDWMTRLDKYVTVKQLDIAQVVVGAKGCFEVLDDWFKEYRGSSDG